jgi:hypothetical protein
MKMKKWIFRNESRAQEKCQAVFHPEDEKQLKELLHPNTIGTKLLLK